MSPHTMITFRRWLAGFDSCNRGHRMWTRSGGAWNGLCRKHGQDQWTLTP